MEKTSTPLSPQQWEVLSKLVYQLTSPQLLWVSGYLTGYADARVQPSAPTVPETSSAPTITVLFGSQIGNAERLAKALHARLLEQGYAARLENMAAYKTAQLKRDHVLLVVVSTYGEGEPPDNARAFHEFLHSAKAPKLPELNYAVLALGDSSYEYFCKTGHDFDRRLAELGAARLHPCVDCDVDFEDSAADWIETIPKKLPQQGTASLKISQPTVSAATGYSKKQPFPATLLENQVLTGRGSSKDVRHIALSIEGSGLRFAPGDALGVVPGNRQERVTDLIAALQLDPSSLVPAANGGEVSLEQALLHDYEITALPRPFLEKYAALAEASELNKLLDDNQRDALHDFVHGREVIDVVRRYPLKGITAVQFVALLRKLQPRLYSIASSFNANPDEAHLTVGVVRYESHGLLRHGVASTFLADSPEENRIPVFVHENPGFRLPGDPDTPIIMVGAGTGVAPFRAFLEEREATGASGKNWLLFGDRNFNTDFLYQREWLEHRKNGLLTHLDAAFSRDGKQKIYVQQRIRENSRSLYAWLEEGAHFYVCGDAKRMAPDVHEALLDAVERESGQDRAYAVDYLQALQSAQRYQRDVY